MSTVEAQRRHDLEENAIHRAIQAAERGDVEGVREQVHKAALEEAKLIHDFYGDMAASMLTFIAEELGEEAVERAWRRVVDDCWTPVLMAIKESGGTEALAATLAQFLHSHRYEFTAHEDDEKWYFDVTKCTSGERMVDEGKVKGLGGDPNGHHRFGATSKAYPWALDIKGLPYYDVHSDTFFRVAPREAGWDVMGIEYTDRGNGPVPSRYIVYKEPRS